MSRDRACLLQPINQFYRAVMLNKEPGGDFSNRRLYTLGKAVYRKQELVLLCLNTVFFRSHITEVKESPDLSLKLSQFPILIGR